MALQTIIKEQSGTVPPTTQEQVLCWESVWLFYSRTEAQAVQSIQFAANDKSEQKIDKVPKEKTTFNMINAKMKNNSYDWPADYSFLFLQVDYRM